ncbi:MAG: RecX family transcriptional regulator [Erysipelotrichaceae bacterium]|nr:RecX family transcriptional regulator [Erysipelotrichaceae bacterium]
MRIGLFSDTYLPDVNGVVTSVDTLRLALEKLGNDVYVICPSNQIRQVTWDNRILRIPGIKVKQIYGYTIASANHRKAEKMLQELDLEMIHVHTEFGIGQFGRKFARKYHIPVVATYHTFYEDYTHYVNPLNIKAFEKLGRLSIRKLSEKWCDGVNGLIVPTLKTKKALEGYGVYNKMFVVPTGLDLERFQRNYDNEPLFAENSFVLVFVGRIAEEKSVDFLLDAMELLKRKHRNVSLAIIGGGPDLEKIRKQAEKNDLIDMVKFTGKIEHSQVASYYSRADRFVSASLTETQGLTFIEAMAAGLPVLARDKVALNNVLIDGYNGYYFRTVTDLVEKTEMLMDMNENEWEEMREASKTKADEYSLENFGKAVMKVYQEITDDFNKEYTVSRLRVDDDYTRIYVTDNETETAFVITTSDYFDLKIAQDQGITEQQYNLLTKLHAYAYGYRKAIKKLAYKDQSVREISELLDSIRHLDADGKRRIMKELTDSGYLNDEQLVKNEIETDQIKLIGRKKTEFNLLKRGIDRDLVEKYINEIDESFEVKRGMEKAQMLLKGIHDKSFRETVMNLKTKLIGAGYDSSTADEIIGRLELSADKETENGNLRQEYEKALRRYSRKYSGYELKQKLYSYLYGKGYSSDDIKHVIAELQEVENED